MKPTGRFALVVGVATLLSGCWWGQYGFGPGRTSNNELDSTLTPINIKRVVPLWSSTLDPEGYMVAAQGRLVITAGGQLYGLDDATGQIAWQETTSTLQPAVREGIVYVGREAFPGDCESAAMQAWDAVTGTRLIDEDIHAWDDPSCDGPEGLPTLGARYGLLQGGSWDEDFNHYRTARVYDWETGTTTVVTGAGGDPSYRYVTLDEAGGRVISTLPGSGTYRVEAQSFDGLVRWSRDVPGSSALERVPVTDGDALFTDHWEGMLVVDVGTGTDRWVAVAPTPLSKPAVKDGVAYTTSEGLLRVFADCGQATCQATWTAEGRSEPVIAGDLVYVIADAGVAVYPTDGCGAATCTPLRTLATSDARDVIVSGGKVFVRTATGVEAFGLP